MSKHLPDTDGLRVAVIVVAAGSGTRLGESEPKALVSVSGVTILERALEQVFAIPEPVQVIVVAPESRIDDTAALAAGVAAEAASNLTVVAGGDTRQQSVAAGLAVVRPEVEVVLVHDSARAFTPAAQFEAVIAAVRSSGGGVIPGLAIADTIKQVDWQGTVERTIDRSQLVSVQTPQGFPREPLVAAYANAADDHTDDAALFAAAGHPVIVVNGDPLAFKITTPWDLRRAQSHAAAARQVSLPQHPSTGIGIDVHAFDQAAPLWLGCLEWPGETGLAGHSDGDAVSHAICDALLSAAGLGDIGGNFGTADARLANAHGDVFIAETIRLVADAGFTVGNVAVQVVGNRPKIAGRRSELESKLSELVGAPVSVSATTTDGLGFTGRGEGITAIATALLLR